MTFAVVAAAVKPKTAVGPGLEPGPPVQEYLQAVGLSRHFWYSVSPDWGRCGIPIRRVKIPVPIRLHSPPYHQPVPPPPPLISCLLEPVLLKKPHIPRSPEWILQYLLRKRR